MAARRVRATGVGPARRGGEGPPTPAPPALVAHAPAVNPCIEITPSPAQYEQLCDDLKVLRRAGATSNTAAILDAVHVAAAAGRVDRKSHKQAGERSRAPRSSNRR